jgi:hypothetical protein
MFLLSFFLVVRDLIENCEAPLSVYYNSHQSLLMQKSAGHYTQATMHRQEVFETSTETLAFRKYIQDSYPTYFGLPERIHGAGIIMRNYS